MEILVKKKVKKEVKIKYLTCSSCKKEATEHHIMCTSCENDAQGNCDNCSDPYCYDCFDDHLRDYIGLTPLSEETEIRCIECDELQEDCCCNTVEDDENDP